MLRLLTRLILSAAAEARDFKREQVTYANHQSARAPWPSGRGHEIQVAGNAKLPAAPRSLHPRLHHDAQEAELCAP